MKGTNLLTLAITLTVGIILAGSLLMPVISDAQKDIGEPITLNNSSTIVLREVQEGDELICVRTVGADSSVTDVWTLNGDILTNIAGSTLAWNVGLISDAWYMQIYTSTSVAGAAWKMNVTNPTSGQIDFGGLSEAGTYTTTFKVEDGNITYISRTGSEQSLPYTWGYVVCNFEDGQYYSAESNGVGICKNSDDLILCGAYTSGALDTMYYSINGTDYVGNSDYTMTVNAATALHTGTTDIYDITVSVDMTDGENTENFTPYRIYLPYEVTGHATAGAAYDLLGALPIMVIIGLVLAASAAIFVKRDD